MAEQKDKSSKPQSTGSESKSQPTGAFPTIPVSSCFPATVPFLTCPPPPTLDCPTAQAAAVPEGGFPTLSCIQTIPGVTCPIPTIPISSCLPLSQGAEMRAQALPPTIPGLNCPVPPTIPFFSCPAPEGAANAQAAAFPTIPTLSCIPTL